MLTDQIPFYTRLERSEIYKFKIFSDAGKCSFLVIKNQNWTTLYAVCVRNYQRSTIVSDLNCKRLPTFIPPQRKVVDNNKFKLQKSKQFLLQNNYGFVHPYNFGFVHPYICSFSSQGHVIIIRMFSCQFHCYESNYIFKRIHGFKIWFNWKSGFE